MAESKRVKKFVRVRYTGTGVTLGVYGRIEAGEIFSMKRRDWEYLEDQEGGVPDTMEMVGDSDLDLPKETPQIIAEPVVAELDEGDAILEERGDIIAEDEDTVTIETEGGETVVIDKQDILADTEAIVDEPNPNPRKRKKGGK
jgi:hypothetical protein